MVDDECDAGPSLRFSLSYLENVKDLWNDLKVRFSIGNDVGIYQLKTDIVNCKQSGHKMIVNDHVESVQNLSKPHLQNSCRIMLTEGHAPIMEKMIMETMTIFKLLDTQTCRTLEKMEKVHNMEIMAKVQQTHGTTGKNLVLRNVLYVSNLACNLISISQLIYDSNCAITSNKLSMIQDLTSMTMIGLDEQHNGNKANEHFDLIHYDVWDLIMISLVPCVYICWQGKLKLQALFKISALWWLLNLTKKVKNVRSDNGTEFRLFVFKKIYPLNFGVNVFSLQYT
ncbi:hypothetical protein CR513_50750, partial [Mucuna pruriens]